MIFETDFSSSTHAVVALKHFQTGVNRLFSILSDPASWGVINPPRILSKTANEKIVYSFEGKERASISLIAFEPSLTELQLQIETPESLAALAEQEYFWTTVMQSIEKRISANGIVVASSPAKINLYFAVGAFLKNGYHEVASCYHALNLRERVVAELTGSFGIGFSGPQAKNSPTSLPKDQSNLVFKAALKLAKHSDLVKPDLIRFHIHKLVPVAGGMAGGSADAAAALVAVNQLFSAGLDSELSVIGKELGADVPFALQGGTEIGLGVGDRLTKIHGESVFHWVVTPSSAGLSTPEVYKKLDILRIQEDVDVSKLEAPEVPDELIAAIKSADPEALAPLMANDLERAAIALLPKLEGTLQAGKKAGALRSMISGSGPTVIHLAKDRLHAELVANRLTNIGLPSAVSYSSLSGTRLEN